VRRPSILVNRVLYIDFWFVFLPIIIYAPAVQFLMNNIKKKKNYIVVSRPIRDMDILWYNIIVCDARGNDQAFNIYNTYIYY